MTYYKALGLSEEPFSNSPSPDYFYRIPGRVECLNLLEVSIRLRRGLSVVLGEVGAGKTTLCRQLIRNLSDDEGYLTFLLLDPYFESTHGFLRALYSLLFRKEPEKDASEWQLKELIKQTLLKYSIYRKAPVLIIDEGQKIQDNCLELLRELLNFETNENKLLQIVIFAQSEFRQSIERFPNLMDRIDTLHTLRPLNFFETREMIRYRLNQAKSSKATPNLFTFGAYWFIYKFTKGFPRKIISLSHKALLETLMRERSIADWKTVFRASGRSLVPVRIMASGLTMVALVAAWYLTPLSRVTHEALDQALLVSQVDMNAMVAHGNDAQPVEQSDGVTPMVSETPVAQQNEVLSQTDTMNGLTLVEGQEPLDLRNASSVPSSPPAQEMSNLGPGTGVIDKPLKSSMQVDGSHVLGDTVSEPKILGSIRMQRRVPLSKAISRIYGTYTKKYLESVLEANPEIKNADAIAAGEKIVFPTIKALPMNASSNGYWIVFGSYRTLKEAYDVLSEEAYAAISPRLISLYTPGERVHFHIANQGAYTSEQAALKALRALEEPLRSKGMIVRDWDKTSLCFSDSHSLLSVASNQ